MAVEGNSPQQVLAQIEAALQASGLSMENESGDVWTLFLQCLEEWLSSRGMVSVEWQSWPAPMMAAPELAHELLQIWPQLRSQAWQLARAQRAGQTDIADHDFERRCLAWRQRLELAVANLRTG